MTALVLVPGAWAAKESAPTGGSKDCGWTVSRAYGPESMTYRLHLELQGCGWWDGSARDLVVGLARNDGSHPPATRRSPVACASDRPRQGRPPTACDASATIDHPEGETDVEYHGEATWKWEDGRHRVSFDTACTTNSETVTCSDDPGSPAAGAEPGEAGGAAAGRAPGRVLPTP